MQHDDTTAVHGGRPPVTPDGAINTAITLSSTLHAGGPYGYGREHNETLAALESVLGELEGGTAYTFASGMAAAFEVVFRGLQDAERTPAHMEMRLSSAIAKHTRATPGV